MTTSAFDALQRYINSTASADAALVDAVDTAEEFGIAVPDTATASLLTTLAALAAGGEKASLVAVTPAAAVVGLHLLAGVAPGSQLTAIDPESEHQRHAREALSAAGYPASTLRFLPSRPLEVMGRLAKGSYHLIYADVRATDLAAMTQAAWPLLADGGVLVLADSLLDGLVGDESRSDRDTVAAREADQALADLEGAIVMRLPLGAGLTCITKR
ncbi:O-methyltransferase [Corynebacterium sp. 13CS0277]|uniref:O-methyltransferase n=1 Tax=Corynebacterium sp. 13CS0277 TaxID=2071994 RepID=UPI001E4EB39E|nr:class I SAM-dependent methyltransferase [Corynebacterium sp. 13CS0277]